jgi:rRNA maturation endonuclease Nob1
LNCSKKIAIIKSAGQKIIHTDGNCPEIKNEEEIKMKCLDCKKEVGPGKEYCPHCGGELFRNSAAKQNSNDPVKALYYFRNTVNL